MHQHMQGNTLFYHIFTTYLLITFDVPIMLPNIDMQRHSKLHYSLNIWGL